MVEPPCGDLFKTAFSCFVYSEVEPKGADCIEAFREMQACFQEHPEKYGDKGEDVEEDDEDEEEDLKVKESVETKDEEPVQVDNGEKKTEDIRKLE
jgi:intermembrane space import and assembly protein 40